MHTARGLLALILPSLLAVSACSVMPVWGGKRKEADAARVQAKAAPAWSTSGAGAITPGAATGWLDDFGSAERLRSLVDQAVKDNPDLKATAAKVIQARAQAREAGADLYPQLGTTFQGSRSQRASGQRFVGTGVRSNRFQSTLDVSWELDFWGRIRDEKGSARSAADAAEEDWHAARLSLAANVVKTAVSLAEARDLIQLAEENVRVRKVYLEVLDRQVERGIDPEKAALDLSLSRADLARAESTLAGRKRELDAARRNLEVLLGAYPAGREPGIGSLPTMKKNVPAGLPSELLLRRPDLRAAERRLDAAIRTESAAKKAFLPGFKLTGDTGFSTEELVHLLEHESLIWTLAGQVTQTVFQGGRIKAGADLAKARYEESLELYARDALKAFNEVETALAAETFLAEQEASLNLAATEAERAEKLALGQYQRGLTDILTLLDSQQRAFDARSAALQVRAQRLRNRADLHLALGGEF